VAKIYSKFEDKSCCYRTEFVSDSRERLTNFIQDKYDISLDIDDRYDFPWFTDGGFKYFAENENWKFEITAHVHELI